MYHRISIRLVLSIALALTGCLDAQASDWGYDSGQPGNQNQQDVLPMRAHAQPFARQAPDAVPTRKTPAQANGKSSAKATPQGVAAPHAAGSTPKNPQPNLQSAAAKKPATKYGELPAAGDAQTLSQSCWGQLLELAGRQKLEAEQRQELNTLVKMQLSGTPYQMQQCRSVLTFWPKLAGYLGDHEDQRDNYSCLLRALLRFRARNLQASLTNSQSDEPLTAEFNLIAEVLGPQRLSVPGSIPFSEEAVNAYCDMACFIYEQRHPGKSVDAMDNRAVFATVVSEKFKNAPSKKDQEAMSAFDLSWAKFKILWTQADEKQKAELLSALEGAGPGSAMAHMHDGTLELVLKNFPSAGPRGPSVASSASADQHK